MKAQNMSIDINKLNDEQLEQLRNMYYSLGMMSEAQQVNNRIAFCNGWMSEKDEEKYLAEHC